MPDREREPGKDPSPRARRETADLRETAGAADAEAERRRRRARFLRDLAEARALRDRVQPRRAKTARLRHAMRMRTFRW
ncbi:hypothetical protein ACFY0A_24885 [Streptomyces sp. NPDC001698]|uniref:hypothetical protein n=1 Tax=unclassified Streptomyces TaxID=2593676 RepID=UPI0036CB3D9C